MTIEAMLGCLERMIETCLEMKAQLEQERERREKKRDERKEAKERRDKEEPKKGKELTTTTTTNAGARTCVYAYEEHPTIADVETHCVLKHVDKAYAQKWLDFIASEGWHFASGALVTRYNFRPSFNAWYKRELAQQRVADATTTPYTTKSWKEREFETREAEIKRRREEADRKAREEGLRILDEIKRNGGL